MTERVAGGSDAGRRRARARTPAAPSPERERAAVLERIHREGIDSVRIITTDLHGVPRAKLVTAERFAKVMTDGHPYPLSLVAADLWEEIPREEAALGADVGFDNGVLLPDLSTFRKLPWTRSTAHVFTDFYTLEGEPLPSPRQVLARVLACAAAAGHEPVFGSELEFYVYRPELGDLGFDAVFSRQAWFSTHALGSTQAFVEALGDAVRSMGIPLYELFNEQGAGQFEVNLEPGSGIGAIDDVIALKIAVKEVAQSAGLRATFLAKPTNRWETVTSGYHLHQTLRTPAGANSLYDPAAPDSISRVGRFYIGGHLAHARGMTALVAPTVTAYKRYAPGTHAPITASWAVRNRTALVRALPRGEATHIENRLGSADANPYLLAAANVAAGLLGMAGEVDPGEPRRGNLWAAADPASARLPGNLLEAVEAFVADGPLVEALGADFARIYTGVLRKDWNRFSEHVTDWEIQEYRQLL